MEKCLEATEEVEPEEPTIAEATEEVEPEEPNIAEATRSESVPAETSKKMDKSGRTAQEKDGLDKILRRCCRQRSCSYKTTQEHVEAKGKEQEELEGRSAMITVELVKVEAVEEVPNVGDDNVESFPMKETFPYLNSLVAVLRDWWDGLDFQIDLFLTQNSTALKLSRLFTFWTC
ncbi:hypothetical protein SADUNF_Sadunf08G0166700 [Salix dunnii]|uniref:Uncharacterized protein n=1 Tax=Salix dunnii TaxID=1413687 RepID=A0A835JZ49_9ROSI|nr:hypothetical protein SADUNF_Sadunf08G0166700 [Salix dunnii]